MLTVVGGNRETFAVDTRASDDNSLFLIGFQIIPEKLAHIGDVGARAAQHRSGFKGAHTGAVDEIMRIDHDTGVQRVGFLFGELNFGVSILYDLSDHLTGR